MRSWRWPLLAVVLLSLLVRRIELLLDIFDANLALVISLTNLVSPALPIEKLDLVEGTTRSIEE